MRNFFENDYTSYRFYDDILHVIYHQGVSIDLIAAVQIVKDRLILQEGQSFAILCDIRGIKEINKAARSYLAIEGSTLIKALAVIVDAPVSEIMWEFYIRTSNPPIPTKSFKNSEEALIFLHRFM
ncbi:MAG: hypothetical protein NWQ38_01315 [Cellulophaga sp.]|nr:hypothetical protein [Cellulophaga sp.]